MSTRRFTHVREQNITTDDIANAIYSLERTFGLQVDVLIQRDHATVGGTGLYVLVGVYVPGDEDNGDSVASVVINIPHKDITTVAGAIIWCVCLLYDQLETLRGDKVRDDTTAFQRWQLVKAAGG